MKRISLFLLLALGIAITPKSTPAQICPRCEIPIERVQQHNQLLLLNSAQQAAAESLHLPFGRPVSPNATNEHILHQTEYLIWYDDDLFVPIWTANRLTAEEASFDVERFDCFRRDPRLSEDVTAFCEDYDEPVFDRGHMVPNGDMQRSEAAMINTFILSNIVPQLPRMNRGLWAGLEGRVRGWARARGEIFIITGVVFDRDGDGRRDRDDDARRMAPFFDVAIPTHFYKIVVQRRPDGTLDTITILIPHRSNFPSNTNNYLRQRIRTIDQIERLTGIDFFAGLPDNAEDAVESFRASSLWETQ